ncbi:MAG: RtcB family protein [Stenomitos frigidus ULC029]
MKSVWQLKPRLKDAVVMDENPGAYQSIAQVMANESDLGEVVATAKQGVCMKG